MKNVKSWLTRRLPIAGLALFAALQAQAATIGVPENLGPWGLSPSLPEDQRGIYVNLAEAIKASTTVPIEIRFVPYGRMLQEMKSGDLDYPFAVVGPLTPDRGRFPAMF